MAKVIDIYPDVSQPEWLKRGVEVFCAGESRDVFTVDAINKNSVLLKDNAGRCHGWESIDKLTPVCKLQMNCVMCNKEEEFSWESEKPNPKNLPIGWYNYLGGTTFHCEGCLYVQ